jgi:hypothetical protein
MNEIEAEEYFRAGKPVYFHFAGDWRRCEIEVFKFGGTRLDRTASAVVNLVFVGTEVRRRKINTSELRKEPPSA